MVGRQHLYLSNEDVRKSTILGHLGDKIDLLRSDSGGYSEAFLRELGAREVDSLDYSDYEGATRVHDLNHPVPKDWEETYDVILDGGSLEHVFQFPTALASCLRMVKLGGHFVTATPTNNFSGHGFYQFSAELFFRAFSRENGFSLPLVAFAEMRRGGRIFRVDDPADLRRRVLFRGKGPLILLVVARREEICPLFTKSPGQSDYAQVWQTQVPTRAAEQRRFQKLRDLLPVGLMNRYDHWRIQQRRQREVLLGVHRVKTLTEAFRDFQSPPC